MSKRENKKEHLLECGLAVMRTRGYNGTSVKDIVDAAAMPKGSFYNYFDSKEHFAIEALEVAALDSFREAQQILAHPGEAPLVRLERFFRSGTEKFCARGYSAGCFLGNMCQEMADSSEPIRLKVRQVLRRHTQMVQDVLEQAVAAGDMPAATDVGVLAEFLFNAWEGAIMRMKAARCTEPLDAFLATLPRLCQNPPLAA